MKKLFLTATLLFLSGAGFLRAETFLKDCAAQASLSDMGGKDVALEEGRPTLLVIWSMRCPCARKYGSRLNKIYKEYGKKGLQMAGVDPFAEETSDEIAAHSKQWNIEFPVLKDREGKLAKKLKLSATPEVFLFDKNGELVYNGAIDDAIYFMKSPKHHYLRKALEELYGGRKPAVKFKQPWGCSYYKG